MDSSTNTTTPSSTSSTPISLTKEYLQPYLDFIKNEEPLLTSKILPNAQSLAKEYVKNDTVNQETTTNTTSTSNKSFTYSQLPIECYDPIYSNFLANAFHWSVEFTNEVRRLRGEWITSNSNTTTTNPSMDDDKKTLLKSCRLRMATPWDVTTIMNFIRELATFEREPESVINNEETLLQDGFTPGRLFYCFLVEIPANVYKEWITKHSSSATTPTPPITGEWIPICFAFVHSIYSTWQGKSLYLEDLYVSPIFRRQGISGICFDVITRVGVITKSQRVQWSALNWNINAINAYVGPRINAEHLSEWNIYRLYRDGIERVAKLSCQ